MWKTLQAFTRSIYWSFVGVLLALAGVLYIYFSEFVAKSPTVSYVIANETNVLDVRQPVSELQIFFDGQNISEQKMTLRAYKLMMKNSGWVNILKEHFDEEFLWGVIIDEGSIIRITNFESSSDYLSTNIAAAIISPRDIRFQRVIFDSGEWFSIEFLVLHEIGKFPKLTAVGKIAGIPNLTLDKALDDSEDKSFRKQLFVGNIWVHVARLPIYFFGLVFILVLLVGTAAGLTAVTQATVKNIRRKEFRSLSSNIDVRNSDYLAVLRPTFEHHGKGGLRDLINVLEDEQKIEKLFRANERRKALSEELAKEDESGSLIVRHRFLIEEGMEGAEFFGIEVKAVDLMVENGILTKDADGNIHIDGEFKETALKLLEF